MNEEWTEVRRRTGHPGIAVFLLTMGTFFLTGLIFAVWANQQPLDTGSWVEISDQVLEDPVVQTELSQYISDELFDNIAIQGDVRSELPASLRDLPDTTEAGLRVAAPAEVRKALNALWFTSVWSESNRAAHEALMTILGGDAEAAGDGTITLNLRPIVTGMSEELGFPPRVTARIPPDVARLTVLKASRVNTARDVTKLVRLAPVVLGLLVILTFGIAILVAGSRRRLMVGLCGAAIAVAGVIALIVRSLAGPSATDWLASEASVRPAADVVWRLGTSQIVTLSIASIALGIVIVLVVCAYELLSPGRTESDHRYSSV